MLGLVEALGDRQILVGGLVGLHIAAAELVEFLVEDAEVDIAGDALEAAVEQRLAHHVEFLGEGVDDGDAAVGREVGVVVVVFALGQRVVHNLAESVVGEVVADGVLQLARVGLLAVGEAAVDGLADVDVVVAVDAHDFLHDVALAGDVGLAGGHLQGHALGGLVHYVSFTISMSSEVRAVRTASSGMSCPTRSNMRRKFTSTTDLSMGFG